jgi:hypothetical protein
VLACAVVLALAALPARASAASRDEEHAAAVESFLRGTQLVESGKLQEAIEAYRAALVHEPASVGARLNLADCYEKVGAPAQAWRQYALAAIHAAEALDSRLAVARASAAHLEPQLVKLTVTVSPAGSLARSVELRLDGEPVEPELVRAGGLAIAPGRHRLDATMPGKSPVLQEIAGAAGDARAVTIAFQDESPPPSRPPAPVEASSSSQRTWALVVGGVGVAGVAAGAVLGLVASSRKTTLEQESTDPSIGAPRFSSDLADAKTFANASTVALVAGGFAVAAGVTLWLTAPSPSTSVSGLRFRVGPERLDLIGSF